MQFESLQDVRAFAVDRAINIFALHDRIIATPVMLDAAKLIEKYINTGDYLDG